MRVLALVILLPSVAFAQTVVVTPLPAQPAPPPAAAAGPEPSECTVTTTVRCTGAAAPYAVQAAQPQVVVTPAPSPPPPPPAPAPQMAPQYYAPQPTLILDPRQLGDGWRLVQTPDGCFYRERKISTDSPAVWGTGMAFWLGGYAAGIIGGMEQGGANYFAWWRGPSTASHRRADS